MRFVILVSSFFAVANVASADLLGDLEACKSEPDSLKRLTCFDAINVARGPTQPAAPVQTAAPPPVNGSPIVLTKAVLRAKDKDFTQGRLNNRIEVVPTFKNDSKKTVVAIEHTLVIADAFGENIVDSLTKLDIKVPPGKTVTSEYFFTFDDNPFIKNEIYDQLIGAVTTGVAKASVQVTKAVFSDVSSEVYR